MRVIDRGRNGNDIEIRISDRVGIAGERQRSVSQIVAIDLERAVVSGAQFRDTRVIDIEPDDGNPEPRKGHRHGQPDIAKSDNGNPAPMCQCVAAPVRNPKIGVCLTAIAQAPQ